MRGDEDRIVRRLTNEARGLRLTIAGSAVVLVLLARLALRAGFLWVAVLAFAGALTFWTRMFRRLSAIRGELRRRQGGGHPGPLGTSMSTARFLLMLLTVLASVGLSLFALLWLAGQLR